MIGAVAFGASALTLFSGFGLGTLLLPAFSLFFPVETAIAATAVVHLLNNIFKSTLLFRDAVPRVLIRFGLPAVAAAFLGARVLAALSGQVPLVTWPFGSRAIEVTPVKLTLGCLIALFAAVDLIPVLARLRVSSRYLPLGGLFSGFFGGLSGHQGALRAAFLLPLGLTPAAFAGTQALIATLVDITRLLAYGVLFRSLSSGPAAATPWGTVAFATLCAFGGALLGRWLVHRTTVAPVRRLTGVLLLLVGLGLASGLL